MSRRPIQQQELKYDDVVEEVLEEGEEDDELFEDDEAMMEHQMDQAEIAQIHEPELDSPEEREKFYQEVRTPSIYRGITSHSSFKKSW